MTSPSLEDLNKQASSAFSDDNKSEYFSDPSETSSSSSSQETVTPYNVEKTLYSITPESSSSSTETLKPVFSSGFLKGKDLDPLNINTNVETSSSSNSPIISNMTEKSTNESPLKLIGSIANG
jgi:hypothetical protein